jgi:hypothetical protein
MQVRVYVLHGFAIRSPAMAFLVHARIREAIEKHRLFIMGTIGDPSRYGWVVWCVAFYYSLSFLIFMLVISRGLHRSPHGSRRATRHRHWTIRGFRAGRSRFTMHIYLNGRSEVYANGGRFWRTRYLGSTEYRPIL